MARGAGVDRPADDLDLAGAPVRRYAPPAASGRPRGLLRLRTLLPSLLLAVAGCGDADDPIAYASLEVINESSHTIVELYVTPASVAGWGPDQLDGETIAPGERYLLTGIPPGVYHLKFVTEGGVAQSEADQVLGEGGRRRWIIQD